MILRFISTKELSKTLLYAKSLKQATFIIYKYPFHANELQLEEYCLKHFKCGLRTVCLGLINRLTVSQPAVTELLYTFRNDEDDRLARFITYGDGKDFQGSQILLDAFRINRKE